MKISALTSTQVWAASARSLTNIGSSALAATNTILTTLAGAASVDLRSGAGTVGMMTVSVATGVGATASISILLFDGTSSDVLTNTAAAASASAAFLTVNTNAVGARILNNDATHAGQYMNAAWVFTI